VSCEGGCGAGGSAGGGRLGGLRRRRRVGGWAGRVQLSSPCFVMTPDTCFSHETVHISTLREYGLSSSRCTSIPCFVWVCVQETIASGGTMYGGTPCSTANRRAVASGVSAAPSSSGTSLCCCVSGLSRTSWLATWLGCLVVEAKSSRVHSIALAIEENDGLPSGFVFRCQPNHELDRPLDEFVEEHDEAKEALTVDPVGPVLRGLVSIVRADGVAVPSLLEAQTRRRQSSTGVNLRECPNLGTAAVGAVDRKRRAVHRPR
jgi:hypothetical protein